MATNSTYDYFFSYRRACGGALAARHVKSILQKYGKTAFLDVDDLKKGEYEPQIFNAIENSKDFILILNENSWRETEKIDVYYEEIIRITKQSGDIIPIEFAKDVLNNIPDGEGCVLHGQLNRNIKKFEKVSYSHEEYFQFEKKLCDKLNIDFIPDSEIEKLPLFSMPFDIEENDLIKRDERVKTLADEVISHRVFNLVGIGGSGKTTLTYLLTDKYKNFFYNIAYVVVNGNIKEDFVVQINTTLEFDFAPNVPIDAKYNEIISFMDQYKTGNNLLILDVNETADKTAIEDYAKKLKNNILPTNKIYPNGWNILILSREKFGDFPNEDLSDDVDTEFLKDLFLKKAGERYKDFDEIDGLLETIHYSPLLAEQLGVFLKKQPKKKTLAEIKEILYADKFRNKERSGVSSYNRNEKETTIISFLNNLIDYEGFTTDEQKVLRHFVLWKSEYIQYDIIEDLLRDLCDDLEETLSNLYDRSILSFDETKSAYKLHGLLADSIREQIDVTKQDYSQYIDNIYDITEYKFREFLRFADCIGNSLCEYEITTWVAFLNSTAIKFRETWKTDYAKRLYEKCIKISETKLKTEPKNVDSLENLSYAYNNLALLLQNQLNDYESAETHFYKAIEIVKRILQISDTLKYQNSLATKYNNLAVLQKNHLNDPKSAETNYNEAIKIQEKITQQSDAPEYLYILTNIYYNLANLQKNSLNDSASAEENYNKAIGIGERIRKTDSPKSEYLNLLSGAYLNLANMQKNREDYDAAKVNVEEAIKIKDSIKDENIQYLVNWMLSKGHLAEILIATGNPDAARVIINDIKPIAEEWVEKIPNYGDLKRVYGRIKDTESKLDF